MDKCKLSAKTILPKHLREWQISWKKIYLSENTNTGTEQNRSMLEF